MNRSPTPPALGLEIEPYQRLLLKLAYQSHQALQTIEHLIQQLQNEVAAQGARAGGIHHIEHAWPFFQIKRDQWERLTPEQKAIVESVASGFLIQHAAGPVPATPKKDRPRARPSAQILPFVQKMRLINPSMPYN